MERCKVNLLTPYACMLPRGLPSCPRPRPILNTSGRKSQLELQKTAQIPPAQIQGPQSHCTYLRPSPPPHIHCSPHGWPLCTGTAHRPHGRYPSTPGHRCSIDLKLKLQHRACSEAESPECLRAPPQSQVLWGGGWKKGQCVHAHTQVHSTPQVSRLPPAEQRGRKDPSVSNRTETPLIHSVPLEK